eukprot:347969-Chlamydomonas_euryale.AAC.1
MGQLHGQWCQGRGRPSGTLWAGRTTPKQQSQLAENIQGTRLDVNDTFGIRSFVRPERSIRTLETATATARTGSQAQHLSYDNT